jgi:hypothetical protein
VTKKITGALLLIAVAVLGIWDIIVATNSTKGDTISELVLDLAVGNPLLPFATGFVMGHLFWPQGRNK